jgi:hypothetical protein
MAQGTGDDAGAGLTLEQLARTVGMSPRNVRAYQTRGLVHPPTVHGRTGYYDGTHVSRLMLVRELQERGLNLAAVGALLESKEVVTWLFHDVRERGRDSADVGPVTLPDVSVARLRALDADAPDALCRHGVLRRGDDGTYVADAAVFMASLRLIESGVPLADVVRVLLEVSRQARGVAADIARTLACPEQRVPGDGVAEEGSPAVDTLVPYAVQMCVAGFESVLYAAVPDEVHAGRESPVRHRSDQPAR